MRRVFLGIGLVGLGYGVYKYYMTQALILEKFTYKVLGIKILKSTLSRVELQINLEVTNNSSISLTLSNYNFDIILNGVKVAEIQNASVNQLLNKDGGKSFFPLNVVVNTTQFIKKDLLLGLLESVRESDLRLRGNFGIKKGIIRFKSVPFDETFKLKDFM